jgi:hypothetical protein
MVLKIGLLLLNLSVRQQSSMVRNGIALKQKKVV